MILVLDASAMIAFLRGEPGADEVAEALLDSESRCYAHALNLCEVFYDSSGLRTGSMLCKRYRTWQRWA